MKLLLLDIETAPNTAYVWGLFDQNISHEQVVESSYILCWTAKWYGTKSSTFMSIYTHGRHDVLSNMWLLLNEADVVVHYNGVKFDIPVLNKEFLKHGLTPPSPYRQVDLYRCVKGVFRFESNKMTAICEQLDLGGKLKHHGFKLWVGCMKLDPGCWRVMEKYNRKDVVLLERLYRKLLPWIINHPNVASMSECPRCGAAGQLQSRGTIKTKTMTYARVHCQACGSWSKSRHSIEATKPQYV